MPLAIVVASSGIININNNSIVIKFLMILGTVIKSSGLPFLIKL